MFRILQIWCIQVPKRSNTIFPGIRFEVTYALQNTQVIYSLCFNNHLFPQKKKKKPNKSMCILACKWKAPGSVAGLFARFLKGYLPHLQRAYSGHLVKVETPERSLLELTLSWLTGNSGGGAHPHLFSTQCSANSLGWFSMQRTFSFEASKQRQAHSGYLWKGTWPSQLIGHLEGKVCLSPIFTRRCLRVLRNPGWPWTDYIAEGGLELLIFRGPPPPYLWF